VFCVELIGWAFWFMVDSDLQRSTRAVSFLLSILFLPLIVSSQAQETITPARTIHGVVKSGTMPLPGATVSITGRSPSETVTTWSDVDGSYSAMVSAEGSFAVHVEMAAFASSTQNVVIDAAHQDVEVNFELTLLSRVRHSEAEPRRAGGPANNMRGFQQLSIMASGGGAGEGGDAMSDIVPSGMPVPGMAPDSATESVAVSGSSSSTFNVPTGAFQRGGDFGQQGSAFGGPGGFGGFGGFGGGGPGGRGGGFGRRGFDINRPHGSLYYGIGDASLNASPFSLTGFPTTKPAYVQQSFGGSVGGPLNIPHIYQGGTKTFYFINYNGKRGENPFDQFSTVPTVAERSGDFSALLNPTSPQQPPVQLYNPYTNLPIPGNILENAGLSIDPIAQGLLEYIPLPNVPGVTRLNFHFVTAANTSSDDLNIRVNQALGGTNLSGRRGGGRNAPRNSLTFGFHFHQSGANLTSPFPSVAGTTSVRSFDIPVSYVRSWGKFTNIVRVDFNRSRTSTLNLYAYNQNITGDLGITGVSQNPFDWGLPNLSFTDIGSLQDINPQLLRNQTLTFSDNVIWNHGKHTLRWGGDFRRIELNTKATNNGRGTFVFSGQNTGYDFADFLLGLPQQTSVQFGATNYYFRGNSWDLYGQDEWKVLPSLTFNFGVRYEYVSPLSELNNQLANLDLSPGVLNPALGVPTVSVIVAGQTGLYTGLLPNSLVRPDRNNFAPRLGFAWKAKPNTVIRGGYGINYNTGAYQTIVQQLAFQPPFATASTNIQTTGPGELTLADGFPPLPPNYISNTYAVSPNYRLGYVQIRNLDLQQQVKPTLLINIDYTGSKGTDLDILEAPNRTPTSVRISGVQPFTFENSVGDSSANALSVRVRKRLAHGFAIGGLYTFSKSLDDASSIGAGATASGSASGLGAGGTGAAGAGPTASTGAATVAQNPFDLSAERGLSSFSQTHRFTADYTLELPFGHDKRWLFANNAARAILGDWQWSGDWTIASGLPFTPHFLNEATEVSTGANNTLRPDLVPGQSITVPHPSIAEWFNTGAFVKPPSGQYGDAGRNSIIGPGSVRFDMAFTKLFPIKESRVLEFRAQATNIFNTPQYSTIDTVLGSPTFGQVTGAGAMRQFTMTARFRF
jgi:trimeric autotransporter adhesin